MSQTGWLLTLEPIADDVAYSLFTHGGVGATLVDAGMITGLGPEKAIAQDLLPPSGRPFSGPLTDSLAEARAAVQLGRRLLPVRLRQGLVSADAEQTTVTIATRGWLAAVPWPMLALIDDGSVRLIERARLLGGLSPALTANRTIIAVDQFEPGPGLVVVDPGPETGQPSPLYPSDLPRELRTRLDPSDTVSVGSLGRDELTPLLLAKPDRFLYVGHIAPAPDRAPAQAALILSAAGRAEPLTARDWLAEPHRWQLPYRVALIGCAGNDTATREQSGLVVAAINAGSSDVTTTRWLLPTDVPLHDVRGTTRLVIAVYNAQHASDCSRALSDWQRSEMRLWRATGAPAHAPLLWASLVTYLAT